MSEQPPNRFGRSEWSFALLSGSLLLVYLYYTLNFIFATPYPGFVFTAVSGGNRGWQINDSFQPNLDIDEVLVKIGDFTFDEYQMNRRRVPFAGYGPGDNVPVVIKSDGRTVNLTMPALTFEEGLRRLPSTLWFFPFWIAGTVILLLLRPRDTAWRLLVTFMYLIAIWLVAGSVANWQIGASRLVLGATAWLLVPVIIQLHLSVPSPLFSHLTRYLMPALYILATALALLELKQVAPRNLALQSLVITILVSLSLLLYRFLLKRSSHSDRIAARLMVAGIGLAFGPSIAVVILPQLLGFAVPNSLGITIGYIAIPALPIFYTYAIYKRQLGSLEFRANRLLSLYGFVLLYPPVFLLLFFLVSQRFDSPGARMIYLLVISIAFVLATPPLLTRFRHWVNRLAYGAKYDPDEILRLLANRIPSMLKRDELIQLLVQEITPSLFIQQSAMYLFEEGDISPIYTRNIPPEQQLSSSGQMRQLLDQAGKYRGPALEAKAGPDWVRLVIPLRTANETVGIWLFGRRDPDDFYSQNDIDLLQTLSNQIATVIENIQLYEALQRHADNLAEQVSARTAELRAEKDRTQAILDNAGEGVFFTNDKGLLLYMNRAMTSLTGYAESEALGQSIDSWMLEANPELQAAIHSGLSWSGELIQKRKDGSTYDVNLTIAPIQMAQSQLTGFVGVQSDISQLKEVDRLKSNIIANVSHELKTPLTNIRLYLSLLERNPVDKWRNYLDIMKTQTDRLTRLIQDLLDLSKLDAGSIPVELNPTGLATCVDAALAPLLALAERKEISLQNEMPADLPPVMADSSQLNQVLTNLLENAINYTPSGGRVTVSAGVGEMASQPAVWLLIADTGRGIAPEDLSHLFDRFYRGQASQQDNTPGSGLGLAISKEIIERHGGRIEAENLPDQGAAFTIWLPSMPESD